MTVVLACWMSYSFFGQLGQIFKKEYFTEATRLKEKIFCHFDIMIRTASYGMVVLMGLITSQSLWFYHCVSVAWFIHILFLVPDVFDFLIWRKIFYPEKPYWIPKEMPWLATNHDGQWLMKIHPIIVFLSTWNLKDIRATRWGLVRSAVIGVILTIFLIYCL